MTDKGGIIQTTVIQNGSRITLPQVHSKRLRGFLNANLGKEIEIKVSRRRKCRTPRQNRYYFGVIVANIADALTREMTFDRVMTVNDTHEFLKDAFIPDEPIVSEDAVVLEVNGKIQYKAKSTTKFNADEVFDLYFDPIRRWAVEFLGVNIPDPTPEEREDINQYYQ